MSRSEHHGMKEFDGLDVYCRAGRYGDEDDGGQREDRFGRLFGHLNPAYTRPDILEAIGKVGGPMDGKSANDRTDSVPVGLIFFGQFVDHDITLDASTTFDSVVDNPGGIANLRTPTLDLDGIYGLGPEAQPYLFNQDRVPGPPERPGPFAGVKLLTGADNPGQAGEAQHDLLRAPNGRAIIGDPRNDENRVISQIQLAIIRFHNLVAQTIYDNHEEFGFGEAPEGHELYEAARQQTTWHYQYALVNDFLPAICGVPVVERISSACWNSTTALISAPTATGPHARIGTRWASWSQRLNQPCPPSEDIPKSSAGPRPADDGAERPLQRPRNPFRPFSHCTAIGRRLRPA